MPRVLLLIVGLACGVGTAHAESLLRRIDRGDTLVQIKKTDADMIAAIRHARSTLPNFLALARDPKPSMSQFGLKVGLPDGDDHEFVWVRPFEKKGKTYSGQLRNDPRSNRKLKFGDTISFTEKDIADWMYLDDGRMKGNFTACALLKHERKRETADFKKKYGPECD